MKHFSILKPTYMSGILPKTYFSTVEATNLTGVYYTNAGAVKLKNIYKKTLNILGKLPKDCAYRINTEAIICHRMAIVQASGGDRNEIEAKINAGLIESIIQQAEAEFRLVPKMLLYKPWEPLVERAPRDQWKWPPY